MDFFINEKIKFGGIDTEPKVSIYGSVDTYYRSNKYSPGTSFANLNGFSLGMTNIIFSYEGEKNGFVTDMVYGPRGN